MLLLIYLNRAWDEPPLGFTRKRMILALGKELKKRGGAILCIDRPLFLLPDTLTRSRDFVRFLSSRQVPKEVGDNLYLFKPLAMTHYLLSDNRIVLRNLNKAVIGAQVRQVLRRFGAGVRVSWIFHPFQSQCLGLAAESLSICEIYDDYPTMSDAEHRDSLRSAEKVLLRNADIVFTTSQKLFEERRGSNPNTFLVPNGVDYEMFSLAARGETEVAEVVGKLHSPIVGFVGKINANIDFELANFLAAEKPEWNFVFVGPNDSTTAFNCSDSFLAAQEQKNIHLLGAVPYESLPSYLKGFDICIMPHSCNEIMWSVYPLKVNEYLAAGKPVVSTRFGDLDQFRNVIRITDTKEEFLACVERALKENTPELIAKRQAVAKSNSWEVRAKTIINILSNFLLGLEKIR